MTLKAWGLGAALLALAATTPAQAQETPPPARLDMQWVEQGVEVQTIAQGLEHPWAVAPLPDGRFVVTERPGRMRVIAADGTLGPALQGLPPVVASGQGGLLDVIAARDFATSRRLYWCFSEADAQQPRLNSTALATATLSEDGRSLQGVKVLFSQQPKVESALHFGCRVVESPQGPLYLTLGERFSRSRQAQMLDNHIGKVVRLRPDGSAPADNPFAGRSGALPEIWSYGHRNAQGAAWGPDGRLWMHEHGPQGGDEINQPAAGANHGWPLVSHGVHYGGRAVGEGRAVQDGVATPWHVWVPSIAPSGMAWLDSDRYGDWKGSWFIGSLKFQRLHRLQPGPDGAQREEVLLPRLGARVRDVRQGPDGWLYLLTDEPRGRLLRVVRSGA